MTEEWYFIHGIDMLDSPALTVHKDRIQYNIERMISMVDDPNRLRPHVKTYKIPEIVRMQMGNGIRTFKCATIAEAEMRALTGAPDVLVAFPLVGPRLDRFFSMVLKYPETRFSAIVDHEHIARSISEKALASLVSVNVYLDINNGNNRTGISPDHAFVLYKKCFELKGINPVGLHVYDGHIRDSDSRIREKKCDHDFQMVKNLAHYIQEKLDFQPAVIAGGSPTFPFHARRENVECSPGTSLLWDAGYSEKFPDIPFKTAAVVITRVVSQPVPGIFCLDLGHKSIAAENPLENRVRFLNKAGLMPLSHSEEHLVVKTGQADQLTIGEVLYGIPYHICPTTALFEEVIVIRNNRVLATWKVKARGRKITL
jgi:D-serine deaminase-like pyridoxal phosphate-dependent protein